MPKNCVTDAVGWPDTVSATVAFDQTSPDGLVTKTGTATFDWERANLGSIVKNPGLPCSQTGEFGFYLQNNQYLAVQSALGKMPGWFAVFAYHDVIKNAYTVTTKSSADDPNPQVTMQDATFSFTMFCALVAPARAVMSLPANLGYVQFTLGAGCFLGNNSAYSYVAPGATNPTGASFGATLVRAGQAAVGKVAAVGALYRLTLPPDVEALKNWSINVNGQEFMLVAGGDPLSQIPFGTEPVFVNILPWAFPKQSLNVAGTTLTFFPRSPYIYDVLTGAPGDVITSNKLDYFTDTLMDSQMAFNDEEGNPQVITIPDPFAHGPLTYPKDDGGMSIVLNW